MYIYFIVLDENRLLINQWNNDAIRTTNFSEGWHRTLQRTFTMSSNVPLGHFITEMREEMLRHRTQILRIFHNLVPIKMRENHYVRSEMKVIEGKQQLDQYFAARNANNQIVVPIEVFF